MTWAFEDDFLVFPLRNVNGDFGSIVFSFHGFVKHEVRLDERTRLEPGNYGGINGDASTRFVFVRFEEAGTGSDVARNP